MAEHNDIVQEDIPDKYKNMSEKQIAVLKYLTEQCNKVHYDYLLKTDDDIVMDLRSINRYLATLPERDAPRSRRTIFCFNLNQPAYVPRYVNKWYCTCTSNSNRTRNFTLYRMLQLLTNFYP